MFVEGQSRRRDGGRFFVSVGGAPPNVMSMKTCGRPLLCVYPRFSVHALASVGINLSFPDLQSSHVSRTMCEKHVCVKAVHVPNTHPIHVRQMCSRFGARPLLQTHSPFCSCCGRWRMATWTSICPAPHGTARQRSSQTSPGGSRLRASAHGP